MKGWKTFADWITSRTHTDGRDWSALLLSLLLAFSVWFIHNLGQVYSEEISVQVRASSSLEGRASVSSNTQTVSAVCRSSGFNHVRLNWYLHNRVRKLSIDASHLHHKDGELFYVTERELQDMVHYIYGENFKVDHFITDTLVFRFAEENCKKVPVEFVGDINCRPQYTISSAIKLTPDSVLVYGEPRILENVHSVRTESVVKMDLHKDAEARVKIRPVKDVRLSAESVRYSVKVSRYVEMSRSYPVKVRNVPEGREVLVVPSEINVAFYCPFPMESDPRDQAYFYIDYLDFEASYGGKCLVRIEREIPGVFRWKAETDMVECIVRE